MHPRSIVIAKYTFISLRYGIERKHLQRDCGRSQSLSWQSPAQKEILDQGSQQRQRDGVKGNFLRNPCPITFEAGAVLVYFQKKSLNVSKIAFNTVSANSQSGCGDDSFCRIRSRTVHWIGRGQSSSHWGSRGHGGRGQGRGGRGHHEADGDEGRPGGEGGHQTNRRETRTQALKRISGISFVNTSAYRLTTESVFRNMMFSEELMTNWCCFNSNSSHRRRLSRSGNILSSQSVKTQMLVLRILSRTAKNGKESLNNHS